MVDPLTFVLGASLFVLTGVGIAVLRPRWIVANAWAVLALLLLVCVASAAALVRIDPPGLRIGVDSSTEPMLPRDDPGRGDYARATDAFGTVVRVRSLAGPNAFQFGLTLPSFATGIQDSSFGESASESRLTR